MVASPTPSRQVTKASPPDSCVLISSPFAKENNVKTIFFEELVNPKVAEIIAKEVNAKTEVLNPLESLSEDQIKKGEDYFSVMEENLQVLYEAIK